jgi:hypothetical protein
MKTEIENPLEHLARLEREARAKANAELVQIREARGAFQRAEFTVPDGSVAVVCAALRSNDDRAAELRRRERVFDPVVRADEILDVEANRTALEAALAFMRRKVASHKPAPRPFEIAPLCDDGLPVFAKPLRPPTGGLFGTPPVLSLAQKLAQAESAILDFPITRFTACTSALNAVDSTLVAEAKPALAAPFRW